jgi:hypothetical protein
MRRTALLQEIRKMRFEECSHGVTFRSTHLNHCGRFGWLTFIANQLPNPAGGPGVREETVFE